MPQWRKIHTKVTESLDVQDMPDDFTRLLWLMLPLVTCREGRGIDVPSWIKSKAMPLRNDVAPEHIDAAMAWYADRKMIQRYAVCGRRYFQVVNFSRYQGTTSREAESDYPGPDQADDEHQESSPELVESSSGVSQELVKSKSGVSPELVKSKSCTDSDADANADIDADAEEMHESAAPASPDGETPVEPAEARRSAPRTRKKAASDKVPPGVAEFRKQVHRFPAKTWYQDIDAIVGADPVDVQRWGRVIHAWIGLGWKPTNVSGMLDFFKRQEIPGQGAGRASPSGDKRATSEQVDSVVDAAFEMVGGG